MILVSFPFGRRVDELVDSETNYQGYRYDIHFFRCHTFAVIHISNRKGVCQIILCS